MTENKSVQTTKLVMLPLLGQFERIFGEFGTVQVGTWRGFLFSSLLIFGESEKKRSGPTDGLMDGPTNGRTHPLIEMRGRI